MNTAQVPSPSGQRRSTSTPRKMTSPRPQRVSRPRTVYSCPSGTPPRSKRPSVNSSYAETTKPSRGKRSTGARPVPSTCQSLSLNAVTSNIRKDTMKGRLSIMRLPQVRRLSVLALNPSSATPDSSISMSRSWSLTDLASISSKQLPSTQDAKTRRETMSRVTFSLSQLSHVIRMEKSYHQLPDLVKEVHHRRRCTPVTYNKLTEEGTDVIGVSMDREFKDFQRDYFRRMEEAARRRKSLRNRKRWLKAYRKTQSVLRISKNLAERSWSFELEPSTYVDIGDSVTVSVDYGAGRSIDTEMYKRKKEISINSQVADTLTSIPAERTLVQLEEARRELQKVQVFSEYPLSVQEQVLRRAFYQAIGPKRVILRQGHLAQNFYIIICGEAYIKEHVWDEERGEVVAKAAAFIKTGDTFGNHALIQAENRQSSVISRTSIQLLAINGEDYLDLIFRRSLPDQLPPHIQYLSEMNFMENFPIQLLREKLSVCTMHHFRRNTVITHDSKKCHNLFVIKYGYCKVFRKLDDRNKSEQDQETSMSGAKKKLEKDSSSEVMSSILQDQKYIERDSPYVSYIEMLSPAGLPVRVPVTKVAGRTDKLQNMPLSLPKDRRRFLPLRLLRVGEVFGMDQTTMCPLRAKSRSTILVSLGAEVIALNKDFYCRHAAQEAREAAEKTFIYDDPFIQRRLRERVNRDVHLEEVLKHYFLKVANASSELEKKVQYETHV